MVVDNTSVQYGKNSDPRTTYTSHTTWNTTYNGTYRNGTGWTGANAGKTTPTIYTVSIPAVSGTYYFVAKAKVDQEYKTPQNTSVYGMNPYAKIIRERTNASYQSKHTGTDGTEYINGSLWWYGPIYKIIVTSSMENGSIYPVNGSTGKELQPRCSIALNDTDGYIFTTRFYDNASGGWTLRQTNTSCVNGTYYWHYNLANAYSTNYYWRVSANNSHGSWFNATYHYTTFNGTYYVATTGSDSNTGTLVSPFLTLLRAFNSTVYGGGICFKTGVYLIHGGNYHATALSVVSGNHASISTYAGENVRIT